MKKPEKPLPCPFCGERDGKHAWIGGDPCYYEKRRDTQIPSGIQLAIRAWNRVAKAAQKGRKR